SNLGGVFSTADPQLGPLQDNGGPTLTMAITPASPAYNQGDLAAVPLGVSSDQRGEPFVRSADGAIDIGAYEGQSLSLVVGTTDDADDGDYRPGHLSLREAVRLANGNPGADVITFGGVFSAATPDTIDLGAALPDLVGELSITWPGAALLTVRRNAASPFSIF